MKLINGEKVYFTTDNVVVQVLDGEKNLVERAQGEPFEVNPEMCREATEEELATWEPLAPAENEVVEEATHN